MPLHTIYAIPETSHPCRLFRRTYCAASAWLGDIIFGPSHSIFLPVPTRKATHPSKIISVKYAAMSKFE
ncbi:MAG: hypothetical protein ABSG04_10860 [Verrucomicrobiota bacterium]